MSYKDDLWKNPMSLYLAAHPDFQKARQGSRNALTQHLKPLEATAPTQRGLWIGGGSGKVGPEWKAVAATWESVDPRAPEGVTFRTGLEDMHLILNRHGWYDFTVACAVFEHINPTLYAACVSNLALLLKPGGLCYIEVPWLWVVHPSDSRYDFGGDFCRFTADGARRMFTDRYPFECLYSEYLVPPECPEGVGVTALFRRK